MRTRPWPVCERRTTNTVEVKFQHMAHERIYTHRTRTTATSTPPSTLGSVTLCVSLCVMSTRQRSHPPRLCSSTAASTLFRPVRAGSSNRAQNPQPATTTPADARLRPRQTFTTPRGRSETRSSGGIVVVGTRFAPRRSRVSSCSLVAGDGRRAPAGSTAVCIMCARATQPRRRRKLRQSPAGSEHKELTLLLCREKRTIQRRVGGDDARCDDEDVMWTDEPWTRDV